jgi:hypothetical protein
MKGSQMADMTNTSPLAPAPSVPQQQSSVYEVKVAPNRSGGRGPLRFEEGLATDTDLPNEFVNGMRQGYATDPRGHNLNVYEKPAEETMRERVHVGSAAWTESPTYLGGFMEGASPLAERTYVQVNRDGSSYHRRNAAQVLD